MTTLTRLFAGLALGLAAHAASAISHSRCSSLTAPLLRFSSSATPRGAPLDGVNRSTSGTPALTPLWRKETASRVDR